MKHLPRWLPAAFLVAASAVVLFLAEAGGIGPRPSVRDFTIEARQFSFEPSTISVNQGERVRVKLIAKDVAHGFYLDSYGAQASTVPGPPATVEFLADRAGTYRFRCSLTCGPLHPFMIGELTVLPASSLNPGPFIAVVMLTVVIAMVSVAATWRSARLGEPIYG